MERPEFDKIDTNECLLVFGSRFAADLPCWVVGGEGAFRLGDATFGGLADGGGTAMADDAPVWQDRSRESLFRQLGLINGGMAYIYDIASPYADDGPNLPAFLQALLGYPKGHPDAVGDDAFIRLFHPDDRAVVAAHHHALLKLRDVAFRTCVCRMKHIDGGWRWIEARERVFSRDRAGRVRRVLGFASDITERRRLLESLAGATDALLLAEENERRRIGRELHDSTTQHLVAIDLTMSRLEQRIGQDPTDRAIIQDIRAALTAAHREIRTFSYLLHPPNLERVGLEAALNQFLAGFQRRTGLKVDFQVQGPPRALGQHGELGLFRLTQEALMNVHRHAAARSADIRLIHRPLETVLEVSDDGIGLPAEKIAALLSGQTPGVGIASMKARIEYLGGTLEILPRAKGLMIRAAMPRRRASDALPQSPTVPSDNLFGPMQPSVAE
jgi:PAS domain S-box-containing protein